MDGYVLLIFELRLTLSVSQACTDQKVNHGSFYPRRLLYTRGRIRKMSEASFVPREHGAGWSDRAGAVADVGVFSSRAKT